MAQGVDCHRVHIDCGKAVILFSPGIAVIAGSKHAATLTEYGMSSGKDVAVVRIDRQRSYIGSC
jgi:hypothetical protein